MPAPSAFDALAQAAVRQRVIDGDGALRLRAAAGAVVLDDPDALRAWLSRAELPEGLAEALAGLLPAPGARAFGPFQPLAHLADGGMGQVWLCRDPFGALVAVKTMRMAAQDAAGPAAQRALRRMQREIAATTGLRHPHVVACLGSGGDGAEAWLALEYLADGDLEGLVQARGPLPETVALRLAAQVADALDAAGRAGLVHRDVKPANIFLDGQIPKLADFGVVRMASADGAALTMPGTMVGSPAFIAPEQAAGRAADTRSDIYALGCVLWYMLTGWPPYSGTPFEVLRAHAMAPLPELPAVGAATRGVLQRALAKRPEDRPQTPAELREALVAAVAAARAAGGPDPSAWFGGGGAAAAASPIRYHEPEEIERLRATVPVAARPTRAFAKGTEPESLDTAGVAGAPVAVPWLALLGGGDGAGRAIHLYAGGELTIGKLARPPVLLTAINYPIAQHGQACHRISRSHAVLRSDRSGAAIVDLGGANGTTIDGRVMAPSSTHGLAIGVPVRLVLAGVVEFELEAVGAAGLPPEALLIRRPANRPELAYALVPGCVRIGPGPGALAWPGANEAIEITWQTDRWLWRRSGGAWAPVGVGQRLPLGEDAPAAAVGEHRLLT